MRSVPLLIHKNQVKIEVHADSVRMGQAAASTAAEIIKSAVAASGSARIVVGTGPSQDTVMGAMVRSPSLDWSRVEVFHLDEYVGISPAHRASFRRWLNDRVADVVFLGFGDNGHIAFSDSGLADFGDPVTVKRVRLADSFRLQQVGEGHFANLEAVPPEAVRSAIEGPLS